MDDNSWLADMTESDDARGVEISLSESQRVRDKAAAARIGDPDDDETFLDDPDAPETNNIARYAGATARVTLRMPEQNHRELKYWSNVKGLSMSEYVIRAVENQISRDNGRFDGEHIMSARVGELVDAVEGFSTRLDNNTAILSQLHHLFLMLSSGDTELLDIDDEDGDL